MPVNHNLSHWPLVITTIDSEMSVDQYRELLSDWDTWLARGIPFVVLRRFSSEQSLVHPRSAGAYAKTWLKAAQPDIRRLVRAIATIVPDSCFEQVSRMKADALFGVASETFRDSAMAIDWITERMTPEMLGSFDRKQAVNIIGT